MLKEAKIFLKHLIHFTVITKNKLYMRVGYYVAGSQSVLKCIFYRLDWVGGIMIYKIIIKRQLLIKHLPSKM